MDHPDLKNDSDVFYSMDASTVEVNAKTGEVTAELNLASPTDGTVA